MTTLSTKPNTPSTANGQRCLYCGATFPLYPPVLGGCPNCASDGFLAPIEVTYDYPATADWLPDSPLPGITRYAPLLPPLVDWVSMGEGGTALVPVPGSDIELYVKDESRNPTWSHKDRLNLAVISAALAINAPGVVAASSGNHGAAAAAYAAASSGNHGAAAAAYAARAGLPCVILCTPRPPAVASFLQAYGQLVVAVPDAPTRWTLMSRLIDEYGYHPASNYTNPPTNHPFGSENYKTIAYELFLQLGRRAPEAVFIPTGYAELAFGVGKGFAELERYGLIKQRPHIVACEPSAGAPLQQALAAGKPIATVNAKASDAYAITVPVNGYRGVVAVRDSEGLALPVSDDEMRQAQAKLGRMGLWSELSSAISFAGALRSAELGLGQSGPVVCISTSSGFKDNHVGENPVPLIDGSWAAFHALFEQYQQR